MVPSSKADEEWLRVGWKGTTVRSFASLDSPVTNALEAGTEVLVLERLQLVSGRERLRIGAPVEGWVSALFLEEGPSEEEEDDEGERFVVKEEGEPVVKSFEAGPLSRKMLEGIASRPGNDRCYYCKAEFLENLRCQDGEGAWANPYDGGLVSCARCGSERGLRCLDLDAFDNSERTALLVGGNDKKRQSRKKAAVETRDTNNLDCACEPRFGERRIDLSIDDGLGIVEAHGRTAVVTASTHRNLQVGDYVVGIGTKRVWRFDKVVKQAQAEKNNKKRGEQKDTSTAAAWTLVVRRLPIVHDDFCPQETHIETRVLKQPRERKKNPQKRVVSDEEDDDEASYAEARRNTVISTGHKDTYRSHAHHASVQSYWDDPPDEETKGDHEKGRSAAPKNITFQREQRESSRSPLACVCLGEHEDWTKALRAGPSNRCELRSTAIVVGVNAQRHRVTYDDVLRAFGAFQRPLLLLCVPKKAPRSLSLVFQEGSLGLRLAETDDGLLLKDVDPSGAAYRAGARTGATLATVHDLPVVSLAQALALLKRRPATITLLPPPHHYATTHHHV